MLMGMMQTVRVWDISGQLILSLIVIMCRHLLMFKLKILLLLRLHKKTDAPGAGELDEHLKNPGSTDLFGSSDAIVKHVLEVCTPVLKLFTCILCDLFAFSFLNCF